LVVVTHIHPTQVALVWLGSFVGWIALRLPHCLFLVCPLDSLPCPWIAFVIPLCPTGWITPTLALGCPTPTPSTRLVSWLVTHLVPLIVYLTCLAPVLDWLVCWVGHTGCTFTHTYSYTPLPLYTPWIYPTHLPIHLGWDCYFPLVALFGLFGSYPRLPRSPHPTPLPLIPTLIWI